MKKKKDAPSTKRLRKGYEAIQRLTQVLGESPTLQEIQKAMRYRSVHSAVRLVNDLIKDGWATRGARYQRRTIELVTPKRKSSE